MSMTEMRAREVWMRRDFFKDSKKNNRSEAAERASFKAGRGGGTKNNLARRSHCGEAL